MPGENPSGPATLDLLEEIVHHTIQSGHGSEAWDIYQNRIGGWGNLGARLGAYERGERICRALAGGVSSLVASGHIARIGSGKSGGWDWTGLDPCAYEQLSEDDRADFIGSWALYLGALGHLAEAIVCLETQVEMVMRQRHLGF